MAISISEKRVIETEKMMSFLEKGTLPLGSITEKMYKSLSDSGAFDMKSLARGPQEGEFVSFVKFRGNILGSVHFEELEQHDTKYMSIIKINKQNSGPHGDAIISDVFSEMELFALKRRIKWVTTVWNSTITTVSNVFLIKNGFVIAENDDITDLMFALSTAENIRGYIFQDSRGVDNLRFTKSLTNSKSEVIFKMMEKTNDIEDDGTLSNTTNKLMDILDIKIYEISEDYEANVEKIGNISDFVNVCRGQLSTYYLEKSILREGDFTLTIEVGGLILAFCAIQFNSDNDEEDEHYMNVLALCALPSIGMGNRMLREAEEFAIRLGMNESRLGAIERRVPWYESQGYVESEIKDSSGDIHMSKLLLSHPKPEEPERDVKRIRR